MSRGGSTCTPLTALNTNLTYVARCPLLAKCGVTLVTGEAAQAYELVIMDAVKGGAAVMRMKHLQAVAKGYLRKDAAPWPWPWAGHRLTGIEWIESRGFNQASRSGGK